MQDVLNNWQFKVSNAVNRLVRTYGDIWIINTSIGLGVFFYGAAI
jgi:hypothetical protein